MQTSDEATQDSTISTIAGSAGGGGLLLIIGIMLVAVFVRQRNKRNRCVCAIFFPAYCEACPELSDYLSAKSHYFKYFMIVNWIGLDRIDG